MRPDLCFWYFDPSNLDFCSQFLILARCYAYVVCISYIYVVKNGNEKINTFNPIMPVSFVVCVSCFPVIFQRLKWVVICVQFVMKTLCTERKKNSQTDKYLVILSSKTYVFEDKMTKY